MQNVMKVESIASGRASIYPLPDYSNHLICQTDQQALELLREQIHDQDVCHLRAGGRQWVGEPARLSEQPLNVSADAVPARKPKSESQSTAPR